MSKYTIESVKDDNEWDDFVNNSPQGTVFALTHYLDLAVDHHCRYWILKGSQVKAGLSLVLSDGEDECVLDDLIIHNGLMFAHDPLQKPTKALFERFEITEYAIEFLTGRYRRIEMALAPQFKDLRPFLWHNYHSKNPNDHFSLDLRYTSYLDISTLRHAQDEESSDLFKGMETLRQRNVREARKDGASSHEEKDCGRLIDYYRVLMGNQGERPEVEKLNRMRRLMDGLIHNGCATLITSSNGRGEPMYATVFCWDSKRAYYLFGAPAPEAKERYKGTAIFWAGFLLLADRGILMVNLEGVNSPRRGWFKLSFGGDLKPYYQVYKLNSRGKSNSEKEERQ